MIREIRQVIAQLTFLLHLIFHQLLSSNYMAPLIIDSLANGSFLWNADSRVLKVPFDNDKWGRYRSVPLPFEQLTSYEVTALFNNEERNGIDLCG